jgi:stage II sporulation protein AA (anti-sigma F factor antagonist)
MVRGSPHVVRPSPYDRAIPDPEFSVSVSTENSTDFVAVTGDVDLATVDVLRAQLTGAIERAQKVVLDLREVAFMDTQGLAAVIEAEQASSASGTSFVVVRAPATVHRLFEMIGLSERLTVVDDPAAA